MLVEFKTSRTDIKEMQDRQLQASIQGEASLEFFRKKDYIGSITIELDTVIDFEVGKVYVNDKEYECVYPRINEDDYFRNLLISGNDFKYLLESTRNIKIKTVEEILNKHYNENNPTSI